MQRGTRQTATITALDPLSVIKQLAYDAFKVNLLCYPISLTSIDLFLRRVWTAVVPDTLKSCCLVRALDSCCLKPDFLSLVVCAGYQSNTNTASNAFVSMYFGRAGDSRYEILSGMLVVCSNSPPVV